MQRSFKIDGVVIRRKNFSEADRLLTIYSKNHGKIVTIAKGIRRLHSRKAPHLELFAHVQAYLVHGRTWDIITEVISIEKFVHLGSKLDRIVQAYRIVEQLDRLSPERESHKSIYFLLVNCLKRIDDQKINNIESVVNEFTLNLLWELGYLPREKIIVGPSLDRFLESVMEKSLKSKSLLTRLYNRVEYI